MIPLRVELENFLSYRKSVVFDFSERSLWMLCGPNGSGKSSVFDAMTYALYGQHRLGGQNAEELIHAKEDRFKIVLDFEADGKIYRIERTKERKGRTTQILRELRDGKTVAIPGLDKSDHVKAMENFLEKRILGLSHKAFTSSVFLQQGKAEKLLLMNPVERHALLAEALDISAYQRLSDRAKGKKQEAKKAADDTHERLKTTSEVTDDDLAAAQERAIEAATGAQEAQKQSAALGALIPQAKAWEDANAQIAVIEKRIADAEALLADAEIIRSDAARHAELAAALPRLCDLRDAAQRLAAATTALQDAQSAAGSAARNIAHAVGSPADTDAQILKTTLENALSEAEEAGKVLPYLNQFARCRAEGRKAAERLESLLTTAPLDPGDAESSCEAEFEALHHAQEALADARAAYGVAQNMAKEAGERRQRFREAGEEANCRFCGQTLNAEKRAKMLADLETSVTNGVQSEEAAKEICKSARAAAQAAEEAKNEAEKRYAEARRAFENCRRDIAAQTGVAQKAAGDALFCSESLPAALTAKMRPPTEIGDEWLSPEAFPTEDDLREIQGRAAALETLRRNDQAWGAARQAERESAAFLQTRREECDRAASALPENWRESAGALDTPQLNSFLMELQSEQNGLAAAPENLRQLAEAERGRAVLVGQKEIAQSQRDRIAEEARQPVALLQERKNTVDAEDAAAQTEAKSAAAALIRLHERRKFRDEEQSRYDAQKHRADLYDALERMLGKDGLQRFLLFEAEQTIVDEANFILGKLSQGTLVLERRPDAGGEKALDLLCRNADIGVRPLPIEGLSGGQKFRVAVALALGIGRCAHRNNGLIPSLIIDEGFGSLDTTGLGDMADALRDLSRHLQRIIVVSHQETFAENFADRFRISLTGGASQTERVLGE